MLICEPREQTIVQKAIPPVIGLEGLPYSGKTVLSNELSRIGIARLPELAELHLNGLRFPAFSEKTEDAAESLNWFVQAEIERLKTLEQFHPTVPVIADRTLVSCLAYTFARRKVFQVGNEKDEHHAILDAVNEGLYFIPPLIYVRIPIQTYFDRKERNFDLRCESLGRQAVENVTLADRELEFFTAQLEYYDTIANRLPDSILVIDGTQDLSQSDWEASRWVAKKANRYNQIQVEDILL